MGARSILGGVAVVAAAAFAIHAYTAADHISCSDFVTASQDRQLEAVHEWQKNNGGRPMGSFSDVQDVASLMSYCSQPSHSGDNVQDLRVTFGPTAP